jgi:hypothetical protein
MQSKTKQNKTNQSKGKATVKYNTCLLFLTYTGWAVIILTIVHTTYMFIIPDIHWVVKLITAHPVYVRNNKHTCSMYYGQDHH